MGEIWQNCNLVSGLDGVKKTIREESNILQNHGFNQMHSSAFRIGYKYS
jgi:hypothetical protein